MTSPIVSPTLLHRASRIKAITAAMPATAIRYFCFLITAAAAAGASAALRGKSSEENFPSMWYE